MATESLGKTKELRQGQLHVLTQLEVPPGRLWKGLPVGFSGFWGGSRHHSKLHGKIFNHFHFWYSIMWPQRINEGIAIFLCCAGEISLGLLDVLLLSPSVEWIGHQCISP